MDIKETIRENLKTACRVKKVKNIDIANYMGVSQGSVTNWFKGSNFIDIENLYKLCQYLNITLDQVFGIVPLTSPITSEESEMLKLYRNADNRAREDAMNTLRNHQKEKDNLLVG